MYPALYSMSKNISTILLNFERYIIYGDTCSHAEKQRGKYPYKYATRNTNVVLLVFAQIL